MSSATDTGPYTHFSIHTLLKEVNDLGYPMYSREWAKALLTIVRQTPRNAFKMLNSYSFDIVENPLTYSESRSHTLLVFDHYLGLGGKEWDTILRLSPEVKIGARFQQLAVSEPQNSPVRTFLARMVLEVAHFVSRYERANRAECPLKFTPIELTAKTYPIFASTVDRLAATRALFRQIFRFDVSPLAMREEHWYRMLVARYNVPDSEELFYTMALANDWNAIALYLTRCGPLMRQIRRVLAMARRATDFLSDPIMSAHTHLLAVERALQIDATEDGKLAFLDFDLRRELMVTHAKLRVASKHLAHVDRLVRSRAVHLANVRRLYDRPWARVSGALQDRMRVLIHCNLPCHPALIVLRYSDPHFWSLFREHEIVDLYERTKKRMLTIYWQRDSQSEADDDDESPPPTQAKKKLRRSRRIRAQQN